MPNINLFIGAERDINRNTYKPVIRLKQYSNVHYLFTGDDVSTKLEAEILARQAWELMAKQMGITANFYLGG